jgi:hypothetical protein
MRQASLLKVRGKLKGRPSSIVESDDSPAYNRSFRKPAQ